MLSGESRIASAKLQKADLELSNLKTLLTQKKSDLRSITISVYLVKCLVLMVTS